MTTKITENSAGASIYVDGVETPYTQTDRAKGEFRIVMRADGAVFLEANQATNLDGKKVQNNTVIIYLNDSILHALDDFLKSQL